jgi:hypothetical protein
LIEKRTVLYSIGTVKNCVRGVRNGTDVYRTVSGFKRGGTVSYCTESERIGTVTMVSKICILLMLGSEAKVDLLSVFAEFESILCFSLHND